MPEMTIVINDTLLAPAQTMTVWAALSSFHIDLLEHGLGDDEHGRATTAGYRQALREITQLVTGTPPHA